MVAQMPILSYHFGLSPDDIWNLTRTEYDTYADAAVELAKATTP